MWSKRTWLIGSLALNLAIVAAAVYLVRRPAPSSGARSYARARAEHFGDLARGRADVVMLGASSIDRGEWGELLALEGVVNRGIAGDGAADVLARVADVVALRPRVVVLLVGINDLLRGRDPEDVAADIAAIVTALRGQPAGAAVVLMAVLPVEPARVDGTLTEGHIAALNRRLADVAARLGCSWLDLGPLLADPAGDLDPRYSVDGLHLNAAGYRLWASALRPLVAPP